MDTREVVVSQLKDKIGELASNPSARSDGAVADWLQSIKPALTGALADLEGKKAYLVRIHVSRGIFFFISTPSCSYHMLTRLKASPPSGGVRMGC